MRRGAIKSRNGILLLISKGNHLNSDIAVSLPPRCNYQSLELWRHGVKAKQPWRPGRQEAAVFGRSFCVSDGQAYFEVTFKTGGAMPAADCVENFVEEQCNGSKQGGSLMFVFGPW